VNFKMVDADRDGWITQDEFKHGCKNGWVQEKTATGSQRPTGTEPAQSSPQSAQGIASSQVRSDLPEIISARSKAWVTRPGRQHRRASSLAGLER